MARKKQSRPTTGPRRNTKPVPHFEMSEEEYQQFKQLAEQGRRAEERVKHMRREQGLSDQP